MRRTYVGSILLGLALLGGAGCGPKPGAVVTPDGYVNNSYPYRVTALKDGELLGSDWLLANFTTKKGKSSQLTTGDWETTYEFDLDNDNEADEERRGVVYDLLLRHRERNSTVAIRTFPVSRSLERRDVRSLAEALVERMSRSDYTLVTLDSRRVSQVLTVDRRYGVRVAGEGRGRVAGQEAWFTELEIATVEDLALDDSSRSERVLLVVAKLPYTWDLTVEGAKRKKTIEPFPAVFAATYASAPRDFELGLADFKSLLSRVELAGTTGLTFPDLAASTPSQPADSMGTAVGSGGAGAPAVPSAASPETAPPAGSAATSAVPAPAPSAAAVPSASPGAAPTPASSAMPAAVPQKK